MNFIKIFSGCIFFVLMQIMPVFSQTELSQGTAVSGESYLDGFELETLMEVNEVVKEASLSYIDQIENDLILIDSLLSVEYVDDGVFDTLEECTGIAISKHLPIQISKDKISLAKRKLIKTMRDLFPSLEFKYEHNKGFKIYKSDPDDSDPFQIGQEFRSEMVRVAVSQPLFKGGALWNQMKSERAQLNGAKAEYDKTYADVRLEVARAYLNFVNAKTMYSIKDDLLNKLGNVLQISQEKMDAGLISEIEHLNVESQCSQIEHDLQAAREAMELGLLDFKKVLHLKVDAAASVNVFDEAMMKILEKEIGEHNTPDEKLQEKKLEELVAISYENRPEFVIQRNKVESALWLEKVSNSGWLPQIDLVAEYGRKAEAYLELDNNAAWDDEHHIGITFTWNLGGNTAKYNYDKNRQGTTTEATDPLGDVGDDGNYDRKNTLSVSVLNGLEQFSRTKQSQISHKEAKLELELSEKDIVSEVKEAYYNYNRIGVQLRSNFKKIKYRRKLLDLAKHRSEINEIQISEYIQAQLDYINEREKLYQSFVDYFLGKISLNKAIGIEDYFPVENI